MKHLFRIALSAVLGFAAAAVMTACDSDNKTEVTDNKLSVAPTGTLTFTADQADAKELTVTTDAPSWDAKAADETWCHVEKSGNTLIVKVDANTDAEKDRNTTITVTAGTAKPVEITVKQLKAGEKMNTLSVTPNDPLTYAADETDAKELTVTTDAPSWDAKAADETWCHVEKSGNTLSVKVDAYKATDQDRSTTITVTAGNADPVIIPVKQNKKQITLSVCPQAVTFSAKDTTARRLTVTTNATSWNATSNDTWCHVKKDTNHVFVSVDPYTIANAPRSTMITFTAEGVEEPVNLIIVQHQTGEAVTLSATPLTLTFDGNAAQNDKQTVTVTTNAYEWTANTDTPYPDSWCFALHNDDGSMDVYVTPYEGGTEDRVEHITIEAGDAEPVVITVTQHPAAAGGPLTLQDAVGEYTGTMVVTNTMEGEPVVSAPEAIDVNIADGKVTLPSFPVRNLIVSIVGEKGADLIMPQVGDLTYSMPVGTVTSDASSLSAPLTTPNLLLKNIDIGSGIIMDITVVLEAVDNMVYTAESEKLTFKLHTLELGMNEAFSDFPAFTFDIQVTKKK